MQVAQFSIKLNLQRLIYFYFLSTRGQHKLQVKEGVAPPLGIYSQAVKPISALGKSSRMCHECTLHLAKTTGFFSLSSKRIKQIQRHHHSISRAIKSAIFQKSALVNYRVRPHLSLPVTNTEANRPETQSHPLS